MEKKNVVVIFGGRSVEHDISIITGVQVLNSLDKTKYNVFPIYITKDGKFYYSNDFFNIKTFSTKKNFLTKNCSKLNFFCFDKTITIKKGLIKKIYKIDFAFLATHGESGENGALQGFFDIIGLPYSSCGVLQSAVGMNKFLTKAFLMAENIPCVEGFCVCKKDKLESLSNIEYPVIVKPCSLGSSVGITFCNNKKQLKDALSFAFLFDNMVLIEKAIKNLQEVNVAVIGNEISQEVSDIEEVLKTDKILSFENKYISDTKSKGIENTKRILPAQISKEMKQKVENLALDTFKKLQCSGIIRFDFLIDKDNNKVYLNEFNTIPGSLANYLWKTKKYNFKIILDKLYSYSIESFENKNKLVKNFSSSVLLNITNANSLKTGKL